MSPENIKGFVPVRVESRDASTESEEAREVLTKATDKFPDSVLLEKVQELSNEDLKILDYVCNKYDVSFNAFGTYEGDQLELLVESLGTFSLLHTPESKRELAEKIVKIIDA